MRHARKRPLPQLDRTPQIARMANDALAAICDRHRDRFPAFVASLPMNNIDATLAEIDRAIGIGARGIYDADEEAGAVYAAMIQRSAEAIVVADHGKFDQLAVAICTRWEAIDRLVTDRQPVRALAGALREAGTDVVVANA